MTDEQLPLQHLQSLPFVLNAVVDDSLSVLRLQTPTVIIELDLVEERSFLSTATVDAILARPRPRPLVLFAPLVSGETARRLRAVGVNYADSAGNLHLVVADRYIGQIEGKKMSTAARPSGIRSAGYRALFALMAWPELAGRPQREIAAWTGTSRSTVSSMLARLKRDGYLIGKGRQRRLVLDDRLLQRWTVGYSDILRPALFIKTYRMPEGGLAALESRLAGLVAARFAWGGGAAASKLGGTFVGERLTLHVQESVATLPMTPEPEGHVDVLSIPGPLAWHAGSPVWDGGGVQAVHPLLAYAELVDQQSDRAQTAAAELREGFGWVRR